MQTMLKQEMFTSASLTAMPVLSSTNLDQFSAVISTMQVHAGGARLSSDSNTNGWRGWMNPAANVEVAGTLTPTFPASPFFLQCFAFYNLQSYNTPASFFVGALNYNQLNANNPLISMYLYNNTIVCAGYGHSQIITSFQPALNTWHCPMILLYESGTTYAAEFYWGTVAPNGTLSFTLLGTMGSVASPIQMYGPFTGISFEINGIPCSIAAASVYQIDSFATGAAGIDPGIIIPNYTPLNYYLMPNTSGASDSNDGTDITRPWLTCTWANANTSAGGLLGLGTANNTGDNLIVDINGTAFRADSNITVSSPGSNLYIKNFPSGLSTWAWGQIASGSFTQPNAVTYPNLWQGTLPETGVAIIDASSNQSQIFENRIVPTAVQASSLPSATINSTPGACWSLASAPTIVYFSPNTVGDNPNTNGKTYWYTRNLGSINISAPFVNVICDNSVRIGGFATIDYANLGNTQGVYPIGTLGAYSNTEFTIDGGYFENTNKHGIAWLSQCTNSTINIQNIDAEQGNGYTTGSSTSYVVFMGGPGTLNNVVNIKNATCLAAAAKPGSTAGDLASEQSYLSHAASYPCNFGTLNVTDSNFSGGNFSDGSVWTNTNIRASTMYSLTVYSPAQVTRCLLKGDGVSSYTASLDSQNNILQFIDDYGLFFSVGAQHRRCLFDLTQAVTNGYHAIWLGQYSAPVSGTPSNGTLTVTNCIFLMPSFSKLSSQGMALIYNLLTTQTVNFQNNIYVFTDSAEQSYAMANWLTNYNGVNGAVKTYAQWQAMGQDTTSQVVTASGLAANYMPTIEFPGNFSAIVDGIFEDYTGRIYTNRKTIGPYEYNGSIMVPPNLGLSPGPMGVVSGYAG